VDPALDGTGANAWLLRQAEARAFERKPGAEAIVSAGRFLGVEAGKRLFEALGFAYARTFWMLGIDLVDPPAPATPPGRIEIRTFDRARDEEAVHRTFVEAFADHWGAAFPPIETWRSGALDGEGSGFDPGLWFVALDEEEVVGAIATRPSSPRNENAAYVEDLGVRRAWRRRGIARALLLSVFAEAFRRGIARVELSVDSESETGANRLYERVGMTGAYGWEEWRKIV
jgi:ribosomal protein S18 acetylase RimI-like enzyme